MQKCVVLTDNGPDHTAIGGVLLMDPATDLSSLLSRFEAEFGYYPGIIPSIHEDGRCISSYFDDDHELRVLLGHRLVNAGLLDGKNPIQSCVTLEDCRNLYVDNVDILRAFGSWVARNVGATFMPFEEFGYPRCK